MLYVQHEFSFDNFFANNDRIYRMVLERKYPNHSTLYAVIPRSFEDAAKRDFPEIEESTLVFFFGNEVPISLKDQKTKRNCLKNPLSLWIVVSLKYLV